MCVSVLLFENCKDRTILDRIESNAVRLIARFQKVPLSLQTGPRRSLSEAGNCPGHLSRNRVISLLPGIFL
jgi:hypothetical protein